MARINLPPLTRSLLVTLIAFSLINALLQPVRSTALGAITRKGHGSPYLCLVPGKSFKYPWTFVSASFVEQNVFGLLVTGLTLFYGGRYLERAWTSSEFAKFIAFASLVPNVLCFLLYVFFYTVSSSGRAINTTIQGGIPLQAAFLVAFKQLVPEHTVSIMRGVLRMRVKHFPALFLLANTISGVLFGTETAMFLSWIAFLESWVYLRYFKVSPLLTSAATNDGLTIRGDASDTFAFAYFFPEPLHTPITAVSDQVYNLLVALRVCTPFSADDIESGNEQAVARAEGGLPTIMTSRGSGRREEAERRRALALKALDQRLHAASQRGTSPMSSSSAGITRPAPAAREESRDGHIINTNGTTGNNSSDESGA
ncbi:DUF1751-domain-containing protein [Trichodelitschia bisporula]|uniref:DUF1751-domain-containing protein n=1 Tax=Trichodelitschia bisporula TaxID=703511 RepID=A0A6G1I9T2_9PEZI|nr:DUF1751-domain-containing protein [Trichodelitschia bisporula]